MPESERATNRRRAGATPSGAVFHTTHRRTVSPAFIASLSDDGVSRETIKSIERDNARMAHRRSTVAHDGESRSSDS